jgi:hypothetical protein
VALAGHEPARRRAISTGRWRLTVRPGAT